MQTKFGAIIVDGSGKIGGHVATKNKAGNALRTKIKPANRKTTDQNEIRSIFAQIAKAWMGLTPEKVAAWNAAADNITVSNKFGDKKKLSGRAYFQRVNSSLLMVKSSILEDPPTDEDIVETEDDYWEDYFDLLALHTTSTFPAGYGLVVEATPAIRNGVSSFSGKFRKIYADMPGTVNTLNLTYVYRAKFGAPVEGTTIYLRFYTVNTANGKRSSVRQHKAIITHQ